MSSLLRSQNSMYSYQHLKTLMTCHHGQIWPGSSPCWSTSGRGSYFLKVPLITERKKTTDCSTPWLLLTASHTIRIWTHGVCFVHAVTESIRICCLHTRPAPCALGTAVQLNRSHPGNQRDESGTHIRSCMAGRSERWTTAPPTCTLHAVRLIRTPRSQPRFLNWPGNEARKLLKRARG